MREHFGNFLEEFDTGQFGNQIVFQLIEIQTIYVEFPCGFAQIERSRHHEIARSLAIRARIDQFRKRPPLVANFAKRAVCIEQNTFDIHPIPPGD